MHQGTYAEHGSWSLPAEGPLLPKPQLLLRALTVVASTSVQLPHTLPLAPSSAGHFQVSTKLDHGFWLCLQHLFYLLSSVGPYLFSRTISNHSDEQRVAQSFSRTSSSPQSSTDQPFLAAERPQASRMRILVRKVNEGVPS